LIRLRSRSTLTVAVIGTTQTLAWASSYYLPAILADPIAAGLGVPKAVFFGCFSASLLLQAALGPMIGRAIDRHGGRDVLVLSNLVLATGLLWLALARGPGGLAGAWVLLGVGMALGLYDSAFATLTALYGREARAPITGITLIAGFASTVGWPLSALFNDSFGWRGACLGWAALNLFVCLPMNRLLIPRPAGPGRSAVAEEAAPAPANGMMVLAFVFGAVGFVTGAMAAHLPRLLELAGASAAAAIAAAFLGVLGGPAASVFALLHGAGNGLLTISRGTLPLALFGPAGYGLRTGIIVAPARVTTAAAPLLFGLLLDAMGTGALVVSAGFSLAALAALALLRAQPASARA
jgi:MFS family permease